MRFIYNADYIEDNFIDDNIVRIAKKGQLGLFDKKNKKILLPSCYSNIAVFDEEHLIIYKNNKKGLYSLTFNKIIIPVKYDYILQFVNSVTIVGLDGQEYHFDIKGNKLR